MPSLLLESGSEQDSLYTLDGTELTIGRDSECSISLDPDSPASWRHARITMIEGVWSIEDLGSTNGTLLNGSRIENAPLHDGDRIMVGTTVFLFREDKTEKPPKAEQVDDSGTVSAAQLHLKSLIGEMSVRMMLIEEEIGKAIIGQREIIKELLTAIISNGHILMIGMPGLAKTMMIRTLSEVLDLKFKRIQFTPDLMPSDITGTDILEVDETSGRKEYRFIKGPIFCNILLADEINRTPPKTQAALLEAMQEHRVTAAGETYPLDPPFFVLATQNPLEQEGTYPLPEAQLDRFMFSVHVEYPKEEEEEMIAKVTTTNRPVQLRKILGAKEILELQQAVRDLPISDHVVKYATRLVRSTRPSDDRAPEFIKKWIHCGAGPRASQHLVVAAKARAVIEGRLLVTSDDVRAAARPVLRHRIFTNFMADSEGVDPDKIVQKLMETVTEPGENDY